MNTNMSKSNEQNEKETRKFCLYAHINMINGKIYIGQTCNPLYKRWKDGLGYIGNKHFYNSINKYGWDNFKHLSLIENLNGDYANIIEKELIKKYNTTNPDFGYNILPGGENRDGKNNPNYGNHYSQETKKILSNLAKQRFKNKENHPRYGAELSNDTKNKIRKKNIGYTITNEQKERMIANNEAIHEIYKLDFDYNVIKIFETKVKAIEDAKIILNISFPKVKYQVVDNFIYTYSELYSDIIHDELLKKKIKFGNFMRFSKPVICLNNLKVYPTIDFASKETNISSSQIILCCQGKRKCGGNDKNLGKLIWEYYDETKTYKQKIYPGKNAKICICITTGEEFESSTEASNKYGIGKSSINYACKHNTSTLGGNTGYKKILWKYG